MMKRTILILLILLSLLFGFVSGHRISEKRNITYLRRQKSRFADFVGTHFTFDTQQFSSIGPSKNCPSGKYILAIVFPEIYCGSCINGLVNEWMSSNPGLQCLLIFRTYDKTKLVSIYKSRQFDYIIYYPKLADPGFFERYGSPEATQIFLLDKDMRIIGLCGLRKPDTFFDKETLKKVCRNLRL